MQTALWSVFGVALVTSVVTDVRWRRIPDWVTWPLLGTGLLLRGWMEGVGGVGTGLMSGLIGAGLAVLPFGLLALRGGMGWGDVKLMAGVGAVLGFPLVVAGMLFIAFAGALQAVAAILWRGRGGYIPYGVAIALGSFGALWWEMR